MIKPMIPGLDDQMQDEVMGNSLARFSHRVATVLAVACLAGMQVEAQEYCQTSRGNMPNGYHYEMWIDGATNGTACMTVLGSDARFKVTWTLNSYGFVARIGRKFDETRTAEELGWFSSDFTHSRTGSGTAWVGIYGWTVAPLQEFYIIEDWQGWRPQYTRKGTITVDGGEYDVFTNTQVQKPSVKGTQTFEQWYSVRKTPRQTGHISISEHFAQWKALGMAQGKMYEAKLKVEGLGGSGTVDFSRATVMVGARPTRLEPPPKSARVAAPRKRIDAAGRKAAPGKTRLFSHP